MRPIAWVLLRRCGILTNEGPERASDRTANARVGGA